MQKNQAEGPVLTLRFDRVMELSKSSGIDSTRELAKRIGVSPSTLWRIENKIQKPSSGVIARLKLAFPMVPLDEFVEVTI